MLTVAELIQWLRAEDEDAEQIEDLLEAAIAHVENETGMRFSTSGEVTETITWGGWPLALRGTVDTEADFTLEQWAGTDWEAVDASAYYVDGSFVRPAGTSYSFGAGPNRRFRVTYTTGYVEGLQPAPVRLAVRMLVQLWFDGAEGEARESGMKAVDRLLAPYRRAVV